MRKPFGKLSRTLLAALIVAAPLTLPATAHASILDGQEFTTIENSCEALGEQRRLLKTFADAESAVESFKKQYPEFIQAAKDLGAPELSEATAYEYKMFAISTEQNHDIVAFLDIYENGASNEELETMIGTVDAEYQRGVVDLEQATSDVAMLLPIDPDKVDKSSVMPRHVLNLKAAQNYAEKYAYNPNSHYGIASTWYGVAADCTNFASQIMRAGGLSMNYSDSTSYGWWWRAKGSNNCSISWVRASTFAKYMRSNYNTTHWSSLKANVKPGDCIGYDEAADGDMDHIGFVHSKSGSSIRIAQHSSNYIKWDSSTGWPGMENGMTRFYRIGC